MSEPWLGLRTVSKKGIPPIDLWTYPTLGLRVHCLDPNKSVASVSFRTNDGQATVFLMRISGQEFYVVTYRNPYHLDCYIVYGVDTDLGRAIEEAFRRWHIEKEEAIRDLDMTEEEFEGFCAGCQVEKEFECMYCEEPFERLGWVRNEITNILSAQAQKK